MMKIIFPYPRIHLFQKTRGSLSSFTSRDSINSKISFEELLKNNNQNTDSKNKKEKIYYNSTNDIDE